MLLTFPFAESCWEAVPDGASLPYLGFSLFLCGVSGSGGGATKGKRRPRQEEDEDYREFPQKKHKLYGKGVTLLTLFSPGPGLCCLRERDLRVWPLKHF